MKKEDTGATKAPGQTSARQLTPPLSIKAIWWLVAGIILIMAIVFIALWLIAGHALSSTELVNARFDAIKITLSAGAGCAGLLLLFLSWRRQRATEESLAHQQDVAIDNRLDATERRITELYTKSADQLGSDKAAVRLAGLYALERLGQDNSPHRQTVVNLLCAYLRMPYVPHEPMHDEDDGYELSESDLQKMQEREVRVTAQRILNDHLRRQTSSGTPAETFWGAVDLDLSQATLLDFSLTGSELGRGRFEGAKFLGETSFDGTRFTKFANFQYTTFARYTSFREAIFEYPAAFIGSRFGSQTVFDSCTFDRWVEFTFSDFAGTANFKRAKFDSTVSFRMVEFRDDVVLADAEFDGRVDFAKSSFAKRVQLEHISLPERRFVNFKETKFAEQVPSELTAYVDSSAAPPAIKESTSETRNPLPRDQA